LIKDPDARLGSQGGFEEILSHSWFPQGAELEAIVNQTKKAPILPNLDDKPDEVIKESYVN